MDTVTHALVGTAISDSWFRRRLGPAATPFALVVSALPDIDMFTYLLSAESVWTQHRGYTHSFLPMLVAAPILGAAAWLITKRTAPWLLWTVLAALCLFAHTLFDLANSWGTMPWLPFSNARVSWDILPFLDVFAFAIPGASFVANRILRWERVDTFLNPLMYPIVHRHPRRQRAADWVAKIAVGALAVYFLIGVQQHRQTVGIARRELAAAGVEAMEVRALPILFTYVAWDIAARDADGAVYNAVYSTYAPKPMRFDKYATLPPVELARVLSTTEGKLFAWYTQGMYVADRKPEGEGSRVTLHDRRFFTLTQPEVSRFVMEFDEDRDGGIISTRAVQAGLRGVDIKVELERLWELMRDGRDMDRQKNATGIDTDR